jgi:sulfotransferase family protein
MMHPVAPSENRDTQSRVMIDVFGVGAPKCGTTWLATCLSEHPSICMAEPWTLNYFCETRPWPEFRGTAGLGPDWIARRFTHCKPGQKLVDISPTYLPDESAPRRIFDHNPRAKLIFNFRHPVEMLQSFYYQVARESLVQPTFESFVASNPEVRRIPLYYRHLRRFLDVFPKEQCFFVVYDDIKTRPSELLENCFAFLDISTDFRPTSLHRPVNVRRIPRSRTVVAVLNWIRHVLQEHFTKEQWDMLVWKTKFYKFHRWVQNRNLKLAERMEIDPRTRKELLEYFREDTRALASFLNRDLSSWER